MEAKECQDYISDLTVGVGIGNDKIILLFTSGEGNLSAFHTIKEKMILQSELIDSEMYSIYESFKTTCLKEFKTVLNYNFYFLKE